MVYVAEVTVLLEWVALVAIARSVSVVFTVIALVYLVEAVVGIDPLVV